MSYRFHKHRFGKPVPAAAMSFPVGYNVNTDTYYNGQGLWANKLYCAVNTVAASNYTTLGYPKAGFACGYGVIKETVYEFWQHKAGTYVIRGTGTGATVTTSGLGFTTDVFATTNGVPFRRTVVVVPLAAPTGDAAISVERYVHLTVDVSAAGVSDMTNLWVGHIDDEGKFGGTAPADYFTIEAIANYSHPTHGPLRMMQLQNMTTTWVQDVGDLAPDLQVCIPNGYGLAFPGAKGAFDNRLPSPEMLARLCVATSMELWPCAWVQMTDACMTAFATRMASIYTSGNIWGEVGNEPWNGSYYNINAGYLGSQYGLSGQPGAGYSLLTDGSGTATQQALAHASLRWWKILETVFGAGRVKNKLINCQIVQPAASVIAMDYTDPGIRQAGIKVGVQMDAWSPATYPIICPDALSSGGPNTGRGITGPTIGGGITIQRGYMTLNQMYNNNALNSFNADLWLEKAWRNSVDNWTEYMVQWLTLLTSRGYKTYGVEYEGHWNHDDIPLYTAGPEGPAALSGCSMFYNCTTGAMTPVSNTINGTVFPLDTLANWFVDTDIIEATWAGQGVGIKDSRTFKCKIISGALYGFDTAANYTTGTIAAATKGKGTITFTGSVGGLTTGTMSGGNTLLIPEGNIFELTFSNGNVRNCTHTGGVITWTGAITAGSVTTATVTGMNILVSNITRMDAFTRWVGKFQNNLNAIDGQGIINYMHNRYYLTGGMRVTSSFTLCSAALLPFSFSNVSNGGQPWAMKYNGFFQPDSVGLTAIKALT